MNKNILITTPDYPPDRVGGISTFVLNLEQVLSSMDIDYEVFVWRNINHIPKNLSNYTHVINVHFHFLFKLNHPNMITFIHGGELLAYSSNVIKRIMKTILHKKMISVLAKSQKNVFISQFTQNLYQSNGGTLCYDRDIVYHNCINLNNSNFLEKEIHEEIILCCFVRDVPHKNIKGVLEVYRHLKRLHPKNIKLYLTSKVKTDDPNIIQLENISDTERELIYQKSHLNLLLSLDHSQKGNVEGFGLTVLEAGKYGVPTIAMATGGLVESVHDGRTGWLISNTKNISKLYNEIKENYRSVSREVFKHTHSSHGQDNLERLLKDIL